MIYRSAGSMRSFVLVCVSYLWLAQPVWAQDDAQNTEAPAAP